MRKVKCHSSTLCTVLKINIVFNDNHNLSTTVQRNFAKIIKKKRVEMITYMVQTMS